MYEFNPAISSAVRTTGAVPRVAEPPAGSPLPPDLLGRMHGYWQAANYLTVGQIYLQETPSSASRSRRAHQAAAARPLGDVARAEPRLRASEPADPRARPEHDLLAGPGMAVPPSGQRLPRRHLLARSTRRVPRPAGMRTLFRQFSTPGGVPSHVSVPTPGSIHEGGELGYVLAHAFGAAFDNPDLVVAAVVGDGEAETGPLAGSWQGVSFLNPARDGAVLPILHLNGYKIAGPTVLGRAGRRRRRGLLEGHGYEVHFVEGDDPMRCTARLPRRWTRASPDPGDPDARRARGACTRRPRWPAIVLRTPKGWTGPGRSTACASKARSARTRCRWRGCATNPAHLRRWRPGCAATDPRSCSTRDGRLVPELAALAPAGDRRMSANPHANGGRLLVDLDLPDFTRLRGRRSPPGHRAPRVHPPARPAAAGHLHAQRGEAELPALLPRRDQLEPPRRCLRGREPLLRRPDASTSTTTSARRPRHGGAQRAPVPRLAGGLPAHRAPRPVRHLRGLRHGVGVDDRAARQVARSTPASAVAPRRARRSTSC